MLKNCNCVNVYLFVLLTGIGPVCFSRYRAQSIQPKFPEISVKDWMDWFGPDLTMPVHLLRWTTFLGWTSPIEIMDHSIWPFRSILNPSTSLFCNFHVQNGGKHLSLQLLWTFTRLFRPVMIHWHHEIFKPQLRNFGWIDHAQKPFNLEFGLQVIVFLLSHIIEGLRCNDHD